MADLVWGISVVLVIAVVLGLAVRSVARRDARLSFPIGGLAIVWILVHNTFLHDSPLLARWLPFTNAIVLGDTRPVACAVLLGAIWDRLPRSRLRRSALGSLLVGVCLWQSYSGLFYPVPTPLQSRWEGTVCLQSSSSSCTAAAVATLLRYHGIPATETEMAHLCLTRAIGTPTLGLYRGLKLKTRGTAWDVEAFDTPYGDLRRSITSPAVITVGIGKSQVADIRYSSDWGWTPGVMHAVVLMHWDPGDKVTVADPNVGMEQWETTGVKDLYKNQGMRLVPRRP